MISKIKSIIMGGVAMVFISTVAVQAQHSQSMEAWFAHIPGFKVVMPATAADAKGLLKAAKNGTCAFL